ncbi:MAG TPA: zf-HC2 domain-containing protein [Longimicrobium sp.]|nr:zf-HC2 domain-containing protein [Longimicrobium sp.]
MNLKTGPRSHFGEADLVRYMDRQLDREALRRARTHLEQCPACAERLAEAQRRSDGVREMISLLPVELPHAGKRAIALAALERARTRRSASGPLGSGFLRAAAVVAAIVAAGVATRPGRALMSDAVHEVAGDRPGPLAARLLGLLGEAPPPSTPVARVPSVPAPAPAPPRQTVAVPRRTTTYPPGVSAPVRFASDGPEVVIRFENHQRAGEVTLWLRDVTEANMQITGNGRGESLVPIGDGLRVRNRPTSRANYTLTIPVHYRGVRVEVGSERWAVIPISKSKRNWIWTIKLQEDGRDSRDSRDSRD